MGDTEAMQLAAKHLADLAGGVVVEQHQVKDRIVAKPTAEGALALPKHPELDRAGFERYVKELRDKASTDPHTARWLLQVNAAPELVCSCSLGRYCQGRAMLHFGGELGRLEELAAGMRLLDCCWWTVRVGQNSM